jgi:ribosomal protein S13
VWCETEKRLKQDEDLQKTIRLSVREIIKKIEFLRQRDIRRKMTLCCYKGSSFEQELIKTKETLEK